MGRITARLASTRARSRRENKREETTRTLQEARTRYINQLSGLGIMRNPESRLLIQSNENSISESTISDNREAKPKSLPRGKIQLRKAAEDNRKITDYYQLIHRGRENLVKSPLHIIRAPSASDRLSNSSVFTNYERPKLNMTTRRSSRNSGSTDVEVITLTDSEDCEENNNCSSNRIPEVKYKLPPAERIECSSSLVSETSFKDLNIEGVKIDEDIEIVEMLPPIPLRDHPLVDLEED